MKPAYQRISPVNILGENSNRLMIVIKTKGCEYAKKTGGCTVCGFLNNASDAITGKDIIDQLNDTIHSNNLDDVKEIDILTLGSFLNDAEVSINTRTALLKRVSEIDHIRRVAIESRAEYVTVEKLLKCQQALGDKILDFGIGLESADDYIRNKIVNKGLSKKAFERTIEKVKEAGCHLLVYLLIKPPGLTEKEAINDAVNSASYVFKTAKKIGVSVRVAFEPVFICENTELEKLYLQSKYRLLSLWSVVDVILKVHQFGNIFIGLSDENLSRDRMPHTCPDCNRYIIDGIEYFNKTQDISRLMDLHCECKNDYNQAMKIGEI
jgi:radical SAM enzyme (TIGR01210 family)